MHKNSSECLNPSEGKQGLENIRISGIENSQEKGLETGACLTSPRGNNLFL